jgi:hypothetical protein
MILDTNHLIKLFKRNRGAHEKARELNAQNEIQRVPVPVFTEIEYDAEYELDEDERRRIQNLTSSPGYGARIPPWTPQTG